MPGNSDGGHRQARTPGPRSEAPLLSASQQCLPIWMTSNSGATLLRRAVTALTRPLTAQSSLGPLWDAWADLVPVGLKGNLGRGCTPCACHGRSQLAAVAPM